MKIDPEDLMSQGEAAKIRGVTHQAIVNLVRNGKLNAVKIGGKVFLSRKEVEGYVPGKGGRPRKKQSAKKKETKR